MSIRTVGLSFTLVTLFAAICRQQLYLFHLLSLIGVMLHTVKTQLPTTDQPVTFFATSTRI